jgi:hypothetical protein
VKEGHQALRNRVFLLVGGFLLSLLPQHATGQVVRSLRLLVDTTRSVWGQQVVTIDGEPRLYFYFHRDDQAAELAVTPLTPGARLRLRPSAEFQLIDSLAEVPDGSYRAMLRFHDLTAKPFVRLTFEVPTDSADHPARQQIISLLPLTRTSLDLRVPDPELFVGEEKVLEVSTDNPTNVRVTGEWTRGQAIDYKLTRENGTLRVHVLPNSLGNHTLVLRATTQRPRLDSKGQLTYDLPPSRQEFVVRASRLRFVAADRKDVLLDDAGRQQGTEIILSDGHAFELRHTYRMEAQLEAGGALVAELFTRNYLSNDRVLCVLRPFSAHRATDGYLYIKDGDQPRAITNFSIAARPFVAALSVLHRGGEWTTNNSLLPGETVDVRLEGENLQRGHFHFEGLTVVPSDSSTRSDQAVIYRLQVPLTVDRRRIGLFDGTRPTGQARTVREAQRPRPLSFVSVDYGDGARPITRLNGPVLYDRPIQDVVFSFATAAIDDKENLFGKQFLTLEVRVVDEKNNLIDQRVLDRVVCPSAPSPRAAFYQDKQCQVGPIRLNDLLNRKTYELSDWSRIQVTVRHTTGPYAEAGYSQLVDLVLRRRTGFDIDVSFPAGLLTKRQGESGYGDFSGISLATLAQLRFYKPDRINRLQPYKIGAGFVALNAFNLSQNSQDRDLGIVILGSLSPVRTDAKLTFPLYLGGGYLLSRGKWFYLLGPGIGVRL